MNIEEIIADHENRILFLENSLPGSAMSYHPEESTEPVESTPISEPWTEKQWDIINQLRGEISYLNKKIAGLDERISKRR